MCANLACLPDRAAESSDLCCSDIQSSELSRSKNTPVERSNSDSVTECCPDSLSGIWTSGNLTNELLQYTRAWLTSLVEDSPARTSAVPEKAPGSPETGPDSGQPCGTPFALFDRSACGWKTAQCSLLGESTLFSETWPKWGSMRNGAAYRRNPPALGTCETGSGSWPTPLASDATHGGPNQKDGKGRPYLSGAIHQWPTPTVCGNYNRKGSGANSGDGLATAIRNYPTPCAQDAKNSTLPVSQLNPDWVEWLMGWCPFFTSLDPVDPVLFRLWMWLSKNDKRWIQGSAKEIPGQSMQCIWFCGEVESSSGCCHCEMCRMRQEFPTPTDAALINLLGSMSFRAWQAERQKEVGGKRNKKDMCLVWQAICFRESPTNNLLSLMWEQARLGQTYWKIDPADLGFIPRTGVNIPFRVQRLKGLGNGQVPQALVMAWIELEKRLFAGGGA